MADDCNALGLDCEVRTAGQSVEGREMLVLVVSIGQMLIQCNFNAGPASTAFAQH